MPTEKETIIFEGIDKVTPVAKGIKGSLDAVGVAAKAFAAIFITGEVAKAVSYFVKQSWESEQAVKGMEQALRNINAPVEKYSKELQLAAAQMQDLTAFTDEQMMGSMQSLLYITQDVGAAMQGSALAADMARAMNIDLNTATTMLGRALEGNVTSLSRYGIKLKEGASGMEVFTALHDRFSGAAEQFAQTGAGEWEKFMVNIGSAAEKLGDKITPAINSILWSFNQLFPKAEPEGVKTARVYMEQIYDQWLKISKAEGDASFTAQEYYKQYVASQEGYFKALQDSANKQNEFTVNIKNNTEAHNANKAAIDNTKRGLSELEIAMMNVEQSMDFTNTAISLFQGMGQAIGLTAAGATDAWADFAKNALISVLNFVEQAIVAQGMLGLVEQNYTKVALAAAGVVAVEALKAGISYESPSTTESTGTTSTSSSTATSATTSTSMGAAGVSSAATTINIQLFNPVFMARETLAQTINDMLNIAADNGWNVSKTTGVVMA